MLSKEKVKKLREAVNKALETVGKEHGVELRAGSASFSPTHFKMKLEGSLIGEDGHAESKEEADFKTFARLYGLQKEDLGRSFTSSGKTLVVCGLKRSAKKYPIIAYDAARPEKKYKLAEEDVARLLAS